jgi:hypothetical protein
LPTSLQPKFGRVIFIDRSLSQKRLPALLERMGFEVELHNTYFVHDEDDDKWIPDVSARNWVILSGDKRLAVEPLNVEAVRASKAQVLLVSDTRCLPEQWAASIIVGRYRIQELLDKHPGPVFIKIARHAKEHVQPHKQHIFGKVGQDDKKEPIETAVAGPSVVRGGSDRDPEGTTGAEATAGEEALDAQKRDEDTNQQPGLTTTPPEAPVPPAVAPEGTRPQ